MLGGDGGRKEEKVGGDGESVDVEGDGGVEEGGG